nr:hypothetical protein BaRGS_009917 [Batillaria attramentaria]
MWMQKVPESLLANPAVICTDWNTRGWPDLFNNGVMLTRPRSHWLHHFLATHRNFRDGHWSYNSLMMSYRTMELYPRTVYLDRRLQMFETVHLLWCGKKILELRHYLSILSVFRVVQPLKIVMHYTDLPRTNGYHSWFREMNNSLPNLEMQLLPQGFSCDSKNMLMTALDFLSQSGGVYIGENTILSRFPEDAEQELFWYFILNKYGGAYQDWDVIWVQRVPDWLLTFPAILSRDWQTLGWPDNLNNGVMLTRPRSHWLHHFLATHRVFRDSLCFVTEDIAIRSGCLVVTTGKVWVNRKCFCKMRAPCT